MDHGKLMAIALGGPKGPASDGDGDDDMPDDGHGDDGKHAQAVSAAGDLIAALHARDPSGVVEAFQALSECADGYDPDKGSDPDDDEGSGDDDGSTDDGSDHDDDGE